MSVGVRILEYIDCTGEAERVGVGGMAQEYIEVGLRPELACEGNRDASGPAVFDTVLARPRESMLPGLEGHGV